MVWWLFKRKEDVHDRVKTLNKSLERSFYHLKNDMSNVNEWILHFKDKHRKHDDDFSELFTRIKMIEQAIERLNGQIKKEDIEVINEEIDRSIAIERVQSFNRSDQSFMNVQSVRSIGSLTPAQKQMLALLLYAGGPLDYNDIAVKLKLNIVTVRRHINDIKRSGVDIKEKVSVKNRRKMVYVDKELREEIIAKSDKKGKKSKSED